MENNAPTEPASAVERVRSALQGSGLPISLRSLEQTTATSEQAAAALGVLVAQIAKSIVVGDGEKLVTVLLRGSARVDLERLERITGHRLKLADRKEVLRRTGFQVGGVSPVGSLEPTKVLMDSGLLEFETVWVAGGSPFDVFGCSPAQLQQLTNAEVHDLVA